MVKICVLVVLFSVFYSTFASYSPALIFKNKENKNEFPKSQTTPTIKVNQRDFEGRFRVLPADQQVVFLVVKDLSPEAFTIRNDENTRAFENIASKVDLLEYIPNVENSVNNKITQGNDVVRVSVEPSNEFEPKPSDNVKYIVASLPSKRDDENDFHYLGRVDRACFDISQQYKDAFFVLTSDDNSRLQTHTRRARDTNGQTANAKGVLKKDANFLLYFTQFGERKLDGEKWVNTSIAITEAEISGKKVDASTIEINFKSGKLVLEFKMDPLTEYWHLTKATPQDPKKLVTEMSAPANFSYSCSASLYFPTADKVSIYFNDFQIELDFEGKSPQKFNDSYDCVGFTSVPIWSSLFITFLLLTIVGIGLTLIMDIRTMDRFDDPKGKTITVSATD